MTSQYEFLNNLWSIRNSSLWVECTVRSPHNVQFCVLSPTNVFQCNNYEFLVHVYYANKHGLQNKTNTNKNKKQKILNKRNPKLT